MPIYRLYETVFSFASLNIRMLRVYWRNVHYLFYLYLHLLLVFFFVAVVVSFRNRLLNIVAFLYYVRRKYLLKSGTEILRKREVNY